MAAGMSSPSSSGTALPASVFEAEGMGREREREEGEGVPLWRLRVWETEVGSGDRGSHGYGILQLVGSLLVEGRGKAMGWGW